MIGRAWRTRPRLLSTNDECGWQWSPALSKLHVKTGLAQDFVNGGNMKRTIRQLGWLVVPVIGLLAWATMPITGQSGAKNGEWTTYGADLANTRYSPLDQITADNFNTLEVAWHFKTDSLGPRPEYQFESTPLMVHGVVYSTAGTRRAVVALDAGTGELMWMHSEREGARGVAAPRQLSGRGLAYWSDGRDERILYVT